MPKELAKETLFVVLDSRPNTLDPRKATDANGMRITSLIFNSLVQLGEKNPVPDLAESWKLEGLTYSFYLKPDLQFSNGRPVNKEDILFSFEEFRKKSSPFHSAFKNIQSVEVLENQNKKQFIVKISLKQFQAPFLHSDLPVIKILPKQEILKSPKEFQKKPIGTGDFYLVENNFREVLLRRKNTASSSTPKEISFQIIRDSLTRTQKMLSEEVDIAPSVIPLQKIAQFKRQKQKFNVISRPGLSTTYLLLNLKNKLLNNKELRQALSFSIHREEIIKYKLHSYSVPAKAFIPPSNYFFNKKLAEPVFNLQKAKNIIQKLNLEGAEIKLSSSNNQDTVDKARVLASQMSQTGLKISLQSNEWGAFYKDVGQGAYEMALMKWVGVNDPDIYRVAFHSANIAPKGRNRSFYQNKKLDQLLEQGFKERDQLRRSKIYNQIQELIAKDFIVIPLWHDMEVSILKTNVENYQLRYNGDFLTLPLVKRR